MKNEDIGARIKERRVALGLTQKQLADVTALTPQTVARYESGEIKAIKLVVIEQIARYLDVNPAWLIGKSKDMERSKKKVYLMEKDKTNLNAIVNALLEYMDDVENFTWDDKPLDQEVFNNFCTSLIGIQNVTERANRSKIKKKEKEDHTTFAGKREADDTSK